MYFLITLLSLPLLSLAEKAIVGGSQVAITDFPYQATLRMNNAFHCGAVILSPHYIATAAHCVVGAATWRLAVRAGSESTQSGGVVVNASSVTVHPDYDDAKLNPDIAIVALAQDLTYSETIQPLPLPKMGYTGPATGDEVLVSGWGALTQGGLASPMLQAVTVPVVEQGTCVAAYKDYSVHVLDEMFCAGVPEGGKDACRGDSGSPAVVDGVLVGLVSWGEGCAKAAYPGVYTRVSAVREFILDVTGL
ncbi:hypothetical protein BDW74DRAFT_183687 [Aspergillus multicolor]|uniref:serine protease n=1 Tax=Aspergillus multicolor TaxID=41759 RepID=UPI003CCC9553